MSYHRDYHQFDFDDHHLDEMYPPTDLDLEIERTHGKCLPKCKETMTHYLYVFDYYSTCVFRFDIGEYEDPEEFMDERTNLDPSTCKWMVSLQPDVSKVEELQLPDNK